MSYQPADGAPRSKSRVPLAAALVVLLAAAGFVLGLQLLVLGVLGEYVGRVLEQVQNRPVFVVADVVGLEPAPGPHAAGTPRAGERHHSHRAGIGTA